MKIEVGTTVEILCGTFHRNQNGIVNTIATINGKKKFFVERSNKTSAWYNFRNIRAIKS